MKKKSILAYADRRISVAAFLLAVFGSLMVASAEMGNSAGDTGYLTGIIIRQLIYVIIGFIVYFVLIRMRVYRLRTYLYYVACIAVGGMLLITRLFGQIGGAYAWIVLPAGATIQPSEFAKIFMIGFAGKLLGVDRGEGNEKAFKQFAGIAIFFFLIIAGYQHDFGSGIVLAVICFCVLMIPDYKEIRVAQRWMRVIVYAVVGLALIVMSKPFTELLKSHSDNYMVGRFLAAADPFLYQYDNGYHLIMSLVSFANGGLFGLGYGNSIHKYMNFPNPSNDFILPVIVEELGIAGFIALLLMYGLMLYPIISGSFRTKITGSKIVLLGVFIYFIVHFILNVGGVSGLIPLTGVPLLMVSSGGSSLIASLGALGLAQGELIRNRMAEEDEDHRG